jgi:hypothetical protein
MSSATDPSGGKDHSGMDHTGAGHEGHTMSGGMDHSDARHEGHTMSSATDPSGGMDHSGMDHTGAGHEGHTMSGGMDHTGAGHEGHTMSGGMDHRGATDHGGGHEGHTMSGATDHGGGGHEGHAMHSGDVAGLAMAMTAPDRDGLELDALQVSLGPVLPGWPTGLLVKATMQGDILTGVTATWIDSEPESGGRTEAAGDPRRRALDQLARLLTVAGWPTAAKEARRARDGLGSVDRAVAAAAERRATRLVRTVRRSRTLAWSVRDMGRTSAAEGSGPLAGQVGASDVLDRVRRWCDVVETGTDQGELAALPLAELTSLLEGAELATARLVLASLALEPALRAQPREAAHA